ncbi:TraX family protein [Enterobacter sp. HNGD-822]
MIIDHTNTVFLSPAWPMMYALGRMAFPLFTLIWGARRIRKKSYAKVFRASVRAETSRLPVCGSAARRNRRLG